MATKPYTGGAMTVNTGDFIVLGDATGGDIASWYVELRPAAATFSVTPKGRVRGVADPATADLALPYYDALATTGTLANAAVAGTTSNAVRVLRIPADAFTVGLDITSVSAGTLQIVATPVRGR